MATLPLDEPDQNEGVLITRGAVECRPGQDRLRALQLGPTCYRGTAARRGPSRARCAFGNLWDRLQPERQIIAQAANEQDLSAAVKFPRDHIENRRPWRRSKFVQRVSRTDCGRTR
jgi:hypothetical protein